MWKQIWDKILKFVLKTAGHAISGAGIAALYNLETYIAKGITDWKILLLGAGIGGAIGFFKVLVDELESIQPKGTATKGKVSWGKYFK